jgi:SAM-dependent methyltransferase
MGEVDYTVHATGYAQQRRADPRIATLVHAALGDARTVLNVGAGAGSYEPTDRHVIAIEPAAEMRAQRPAHLAPAIAASAEALPLDDKSVDAAMAMITMHQWGDQARGLAELRRVTRGPIVLLTFDPDALASFWLAEYSPEVITAERKRFPTKRELEAMLGPFRADVVPIPNDCTDGFTEAHWARPERFLDPVVRRSQSCWTFVSEVDVARFERDLRRDLDDGTWDRKHGALRTQPTYEGSVRLVVAYG